MAGLKTKMKRKGVIVFKLKTVVILCLSALLVLAFTAPALAETKVDFSGAFRVRHWTRNNTATLADESEDEFAQQYFDQRFRLYTTFMPSEALAVDIKMEAANNKWGTQESGLRYVRAARNPNVLTSVTGVDSDGDGVIDALQTTSTSLGGAHYDSSPEFYEAYMTIKSKLGMFVIGRSSASVAGLQLLGYSGSGFQASEVFDSEGPADRIKWGIPIGNFFIAALYQKNLELDEALAANDQDSDMFAFQPVIKFANGAANFLVAHLRSRTTPGVDINATMFDPSALVQFGPVALHGEFKYFIGTMDFEDDALEDQDLTGWAFYIDVLYNYGPGEVCLQYFYSSGDDDASDNELGGQAGSGADFTPFLVATDSTVSGPIGGQTLNDASNWSMVGLWADHSITEDLMIHAAVGYFRINEVGEEAGYPADTDNHYGNEIDLGLQWNLMGNLTFTTIAGYFMSGDYFQFGDDNVEVGDAYVWKNQLNLSF